MELKETHISWVFLAGELVFKLKKPVKFDFLDFSALELREQACRDELRLNRRLAAEIYLDVVPITEHGDRFQIGGSGEVVDWLVRMRRLPAGLTLDELQLAGKLRPAHIDRLAETLVKFYRQLPAAPIDGEQYLARYIAHVRENRRELLAQAHHLPESHLPENQVRRIHATQLQLLATESQLFAERVRQGCVVEGHGDLRPEHICLREPPVVFDCIEFSAEFRTLDRLDEMAFLASECDQLGANWVGPQLLARYETLRGEKASLLLWNFYKSYRACVRAKVAALRAEQLPAAEREPAFEQARDYLRQAEEYLRPWSRPACLVVGGLSGSGKSTLARALQEKLGLELLRSDVVRQELFAAAREIPPAGNDLYSAENKQRVYDDLHRRAAELLRQGVSVVLDATYEQPAQIERAIDAAQAANTGYVAIRCTCPPEVAQRRIRGRRAAGTDASQADEAVFARQHQMRASWPAHVRQMEVDTTQPLAEQVNQVISLLRQQSVKHQGH